jgi:hypothetical protein
MRMLLIAILLLAGCTTPEQRPRTHINDRSR